MKSVFFETKNTATRDVPYFSDHTHNINYLSHFHREIELCWVRSGSVDIVCENQRFTLNQDDICVFMPGEIHSFLSPLQNHLYILKLDCNHTLQTTDCSLLHLPLAPLRKGTPLNGILIGLISEMHTELTHKKAGYEYLVSAIAHRLIGTLLRFGEAEQIDLKENQKHKHAVCMLDKVNEYIENHYEKNITLDEIAKQCNFSKYYFSHFFKEITGSSFYTYLTLFRLEKARDLLLHSDKKIYDLALDAGFSNVRAFYRAFINTFEKTPSKYKSDMLGH